MGWKKTVYTRNQEATNYQKRMIEKISRKHPERDYFKSYFKNITFIGGYTYKEYTPASNKEENGIDQICEKFIKGWAYPHEDSPLIVYGRVYDIGFDDQCVKITKAGKDFLKSSFSKLLNISEEQIKSIEWRFENTDNIEDICSFEIFIKDKQEKIAQIINYWTYCDSDTSVISPIFKLSEKELQKYLKEEE